MLRKILKYFLLLLVIAAIAFFIFAPGYIDRDNNKVTLKVTNPHKVAWYDSIPFIADLHCDALLWDRNNLEKHSYGHVDIPRMREANMAFQVFTVVSKTPRGINIEQNDDKTDQIALLSFAQLRNPKDWFSVRSRALHQCGDLFNTARKSGAEFRVITSRAELQQFISDRGSNQRLTAGMLGIEGAHCLGDDISNLQSFYDAGVRYIGLTHFFDNAWGGSAHGIAKGGLTEKGKSLVRKMDSLHILIDLAHASPKTIDDIFAFTQSPVLISHTGVKGICDNTRNLSDAHLAEIGRRNGLVGIGLWETAVCGTDAEATAKSIRYVADKIGVDKVALGSDFDGATTTHFDVTGLPLIVDALLKEGFTREEIYQIMGGNVRDFFLRNLPEK
ncbi:MAG: dipeptidase [Sphingobacteriales bacterium]|nr:dipeptidase [Sphingobacteriales bacterium]